MQPLDQNSSLEPTKLVETKIVFDWDQNSGSFRIPANLSQKLQFKASKIELSLFLRGLENLMKKDNVQRKNKFLIVFNVFVLITMICIIVFELNYELNTQKGKNQNIGKTMGIIIGSMFIGILTLIIINSKFANNPLLTFKDSRTLGEHYLENTKKLWNKRGLVWKIPNGSFPKWLELWLDHKIKIEKVETEGQDTSVLNMSDSRTLDISKVEVQV